VGSGIWYFFDENSETCNLSSCELREENNCANPYSPNFVQMSSTSPYQITMPRNIDEGFTENFCFRCLHTLPTVISDHVSIKVTQT
jgi:hypothetical protein